MDQKVEQTQEHATEVEQQQEQQATEQAAHDAEVDAAERAAIASARGNQGEEQQQAQVQTQAEPQPENPEATPEPAPQPLIGGMTEDQLKAALASAARVPELEGNVTKRIDQIFGKFGELQRMLQQQSATAPQGVAAEKKLAASMKRMREAGFEDMAEMLEGDLDELLGSMSGKGGDPAVFESKLDAKIGGFEQRIAQTLLSFRHKDWQTVRGTPEFKAWETTLDPAVRAELNSTWDTSFVADRLDEFKASLKKAEPEAQPANSEDHQRQLNKRLEGAMTPEGAGSGVPRATITEDEAEAAAIKARRSHLRQPIT